MKPTPRRGLHTHRCQPYPPQLGKPANQFVVFHRRQVCVSPKITKRVSTHKQPLIAIRQRQPSAAQIHEPFNRPQRPLGSIDVKFKRPRHHAPLGKCFADVLWIISGGPCVGVHKQQPFTGRHRRPSIHLLTTPRLTRHHHRAHRPRNLPRIVFTGPVGNNQLQRTTCGAGFKCLKGLADHPRLIQRRHNHREARLTRLCPLICLTVRCAHH